MALAFALPFAAGRAFGAIGFSRGHEKATSYLAHDALHPSIHVSFDLTVDCSIRVLVVHDSLDTCHVRFLFQADGEETWAAWAPEEAVVDVRNDGRHFLLEQELALLPMGQRLQAGLGPEPL